MAGDQLRRQARHASELLVAVHCERVTLFASDKTDSAHLNLWPDTSPQFDNKPATFSTSTKGASGHGRGVGWRRQSRTPNAIAGTACGMRPRGNCVHRKC